MNMCTTFLFICVRITRASIEIFRLINCECTKVNKFVFAQVNSQLIQKLVEYIVTVQRDISDTVSWILAAFEK